MIYLFSGNNRYLMIEEMKRWKKNFTQKYGPENFSYIDDISKIEPASLHEIIFGRSLFSEKRLVFVDNFLSGNNLEEILIGSLEGVPEDTIVVFLAENPDKRKSNYKTLAKIASLKEFISGDESQIFQQILSRYPNKIDSGALRYLISMKGGNEEKVTGEIEKLLILFPKIEKSHIESHIKAEFEESIFLFIDTLLLKNSQKVFQDFQILLENSNIYALYHSIVANLRVFLYITFLKQSRKNAKQISDILQLGKRSFLVNKNTKASFPEIQTLFESLVSIDGKMKSGKLVSSDDTDIQKEIEKAFLHFLA